jgi:hypothetical protein
LPHSCHTTVGLEGTAIFALIISDLADRNVASKERALPESLFLRGCSFIPDIKLE